jgi:hypothetical protein
VVVLIALHFLQRHSALLLSACLIVSDGRERVVPHQEEQEACICSLVSSSVFVQEHVHLHREVLHVLGVSTFTSDMSMTLVGWYLTITAA